MAVVEFCDIHKSENEKVVDRQQKLKKAQSPIIANILGLGQASDKKLDMVGLMSIY